MKTEQLYQVTTVGPHRVDVMMEELGKMKHKNNSNQSKLNYCLQNNWVAMDCVLVKNKQICKGHAGGLHKISRSWTTRRAKNVHAHVFTYTTRMGKLG